MLRRLRRILFAVVLALTTATVLLVVAVRPALQDATDTVQERWEPLRDPLGTRYAALGRVAETLQAAGAGDRSVSRELRDRLALWNLLRVTTDAAGQAATAADLEGLAARVRVTTREVDRLAVQTEIAEAMRAFDATAPTENLVRAYNRSVLDYERRRRAPLRSIVADLDGYGPRRSLQLSLP